MARVWGSWTSTASSTNLQRFRLGIDYTVSGTRVTVQGYVFQSAYAIGKDITLTRTGRLSGTYSVRVSHGSNGGTTSLGRGGSVTGTRGSTLTIGGRATNLLHGKTATVSVKVTIPAGKPATPARPTVSSIKTNSVKLAWKHPSNNGAKLTEYQVQRATNSGFTSGVSTVSGVTGTSRTMTGLTGNTTYYYRIRVRNSAGWSGWSPGRSVKTLVGTPRVATGVTATRVSDSQANISWTNNTTTAAPYASVSVERKMSGVSGEWGAWKNLSGTLSAGATSWTDTTTAPNNQYRYRVVARNAGGTANSNESSSLRTTPFAPINVEAEKLANGNILVTHTSQPPYSDYLSQVIQVRQGTGAWTTLATVSGAGAYTHVDPSPTVSNQYRIATRSTWSNPGTLTSAYSAPSNIVQILSKPGPPRLISPIGGAVDNSEATRYEWRHNSLDSSKQTAYERRLRLDGGPWRTASGTNNWSTATNSTFVGQSGRVEWQMRTKGVHPDWSDWSQIESFTLAARPTVAINEPAYDLYDTSRLELYFGYYQEDDSRQSQVEAELLDEAGVLVESQHWSGTSTRRTFNARLEDSTAYSVRVRALAGNGLWSHWEEHDFTTDFLAPVKCAPVIGWDNTTGSATVTATAVETATQYRWTGAPENSPSTATTGDGVTTNFFPNPSMATSSGQTVLATNILTNEYQSLTEPYGFDLAPAGESTQRPAILPGVDGRVPVGVLPVHHRNSGDETSKYYWTYPLGVPEIPAKIGWSPGRTYTVSARLRIVNPQTSRHERWEPWRITIGYTDIYGTRVNDGPSYSVTAPNEAGTYDLRAVFEYPETRDLITSVFPVFWNGLDGARGYWENIMIVEGDYVGPHFDATMSSAGGMKVESDPDGVSRILVTSLPDLEVDGPGTLMRSTDWAKNGEYSAKLTRTGDGPLSVKIKDMGDANKVWVWRYQDRELNTEEHFGTVRFGPESVSEAAPNVEGEHLLVATRAPGDETDEITIEAGFADIGESIYFTCITAVDNPDYHGGPFSGATRGTVEAETVTYQRRDTPLSPWVTLIDQAPVGTQITDHIPGLLEPEYRVITETDMPSSATGDVVPAPPPRDGHWPVFLNTGQGFEETYTLYDKTQLSVDSERGKTRHKRAGRSRPVTKFGQHRDKNLTLTASRNRHSPGSTVDEIIELEDRPEIVCYRDILGHKEFVTIDSVSASVERDARWTINVPMTVEDHEETGIVEDED